MRLLVQAELQIRHTQSCCYGNFVGEPFQTRNKMTEKCSGHEHSKYHQTSLKVAEESCCAVGHSKAGVLNVLGKNVIK